MQSKPPLPRKSRSLRRRSVLPSADRKFQGLDARRRVLWLRLKLKLARSRPRCSRPASRPMGSFISEPAIAPAQTCISKACRRPLRARSCSTSRFLSTGYFAGCVVGFGFVAAGAAVVLRLGGCRFAVVGLGLADVGFDAAGAGPSRLTVNRTMRTGVTGRSLRAARQCVRSCQRHPGPRSLGRKLCGCHSGAASELP